MLIDENRLLERDDRESKDEILNRDQSVKTIDRLQKQLSPDDSNLREGRFVASESTRASTVKVNAGTGDTQVEGQVNGQKHSFEKLVSNIENDNWINWLNVDPLADFREPGKGF
ncbi:hypothetical protein [Microbulbifer sp. JMSA003]|uniref:hypothetical protein n=1 Tax=unclassified Microbulbifer TaxID=2619833 RepID=UPI004039FE36